MPSITIYEGSVDNGAINTAGMLLYPNGEVYYGQIMRCERSGYGKQIWLDGSYFEGMWQSDKMNGPKCKYFD